jgi:hypothetical protein
VPVSSGRPSSIFAAHVSLPRPQKIFPKLTTKVMIIRAFPCDISLALPPFAWRGNGQDFFVRRGGKMDFFTNWLKHDGPHTFRKPEKLPSYAWSYFDHIAAMYGNIGKSCADADEIIKNAAEHPESLHWGNIFHLESIVLSLQPDNTLQRNVWVLRERFREISGPTVYNAYLASNPPTETDTPEKLSLLKADLTRLLDVLHWYYALIPNRERLRKSLTKRCARMIIWYTLILIAILLACALHAHRPIIPTPPHFHTAIAIASCVVYWGIIGGFVSSQRRMQSIPADGDPLISVLGLDDAGYYLWLSPLLGAVFAVILAWMFMGGIVQGALFPSFGPPPKGEGWFSDLFSWQSLQGPAEYAKLFVWSFLAGFAERLVPDNLDRLASRLDINQQKSAPAPTTPPTPPIHTTPPAAPKEEPKLENEMQQPEEGTQQGNQDASIDEGKKNDT